MKDDLIQWRKLGYDLITKCQKQIDLNGDNAEVSLIMPGRWCQKILGVRGEIVLEHVPCQSR